MWRIALTQDHTLPARIQKILIKGTFDKTTKTETVLSHGFKIYQIINTLEQANTQTEVTIAFYSNKYSMYDERDYYFYETYIKVKESTEIQTVNDMIKQQYEKARQTQTARSHQHPKQSKLESKQHIQPIAKMFFLYFFNFFEKSCIFFDILKKNT